MECVACSMRSLRLSSARQTTRTLPQQQIRHESTARRLRTKHRIAPAPSFTPGPEQKEAQIIYNPPSSMPNVYHTPSIFLPRSDPRRPASPPTPAATTEPSSSAPLSTLAALAASRTSKPLSHLPIVGKPHERKYHVTQAQVEEMRRLRADDHRTWTVRRLAEKFDCSEAFVRLCAPSAAAKAEADERLASVQARWGRTKRESREDRVRRKEQWGMGL